MPIDAQIRGLSQKYMGGRPDTHADAMFKTDVANAESNHPIPVSNFMNAQCMYPKIYTYVLHLY